MPVTKTRARAAATRPGSLTRSPGVTGGARAQAHEWVLEASVLWHLAASYGNFKFNDRPATISAPQCRGLGVQTRRFNLRVLALSQADALMSQFKMRRVRLELKVAPA